MGTKLKFLVTKVISFSRIGDLISRNFEPCPNCFGDVTFNGGSIVFTICKSGWMTFRRNKSSLCTRVYELHFTTSKIHGKECKTSEHASTTVNVTLKRCNAGIGRRAKRETALVSYNDLDAQH